ncbi:MAG: hypothetical protein ACRDLN_17700, partial [Solirubrobacteraceae bacterium]
MASLRQLVGSPALNPLLALLSRPRRDPQVTHVALIEDLGDLDRVAPGALVLLTNAASGTASGYRFDMALRLARSRGVAAIVLSAGHAASVTPSSAAIADRSGIAILATDGESDIAQLAIAIARELAGGADVALLRAHTALRAIEAHPPGGAPESLAVRAGAALGIGLRVVPEQPPAGTPCAPIVVESQVEGWLAAAPQEGDMGLAVDIVLHAAAAAAGRAMRLARQAEELPIQSREEVLTELLSAPPQGRAPLVQRARTLGVPIDGWHVAVRMEFEDLTDTRPDDAVAVYERRVRLARTVLAAIREQGGTWHSARAGQALVLLQMF